MLRLQQAGEGLGQSVTPAGSIEAAALLVSALRCQCLMPELSWSGSAKAQLVPEETGPNLLHGRGAAKHSPRKTTRSKSVFASLSPGAGLWKQRCAANNHSQA